MFKRFPVRGQFHPVLRNRNLFGVKVQGINIAEAVAEKLRAVFA